MKVTVLIENIAPEGLTCEHGLAVYIEHEGKNYLLDAGSSDAMLENAAKLGVDLTKVDLAALSHGHFDHSGGFCAFFEGNAAAPLYLRPQATGEILARNSARGLHYIGIPKDLAARTDRLKFVEGPTEIAPGVWCLPHSVAGLEERGARMQMYCQGPDGMVPDGFAHEQTLVFVTGEGLVIFNSCSHAGADAVVEEAMAAFPGQPVRAFFGGFHLMGPDGVTTLGVTPEEAVRLGSRLVELGVAEIWTGHCTGNPAMELLKPVLGERLHYLSTGTVVEL